MLLDDLRWRNLVHQTTDDAGLSRMARAAGWDYAELIRRIAEVALREAQGTKAARELLAAPRRARAPRTA